MRYEPSMTYQKGGMSAFDTFFRFVLIRAPFSEVLPPCVGVSRALDYGAVLTEGVTAPPIIHQKQGKAGKGPWFDQLPGYLISTPAGQSGLTLIECPPFHTLRRVLHRLSPGLEMLAIESDLERIKDQRHAFFVYTGAELRRHVELRKWGSKATNWKWTEDGTPQPWEDIQAYETEELQDRLSRPRLLSYAKAWGLDPEHHLFRRNFDKSVLISSGFVRSGDDYRPRSRDYEDEYRRALSLGIGDPDGELSSDEGQRVFMQRLEKAGLWHAKAAKSYTKLKKSKELTPAQIEDWYVTSERDLLETLDRFADPHPLCVWTADDARAIDPLHPSTKRLQINKKHWKILRDLSVRLRQLLPDEESDLWPGYFELEAINRQALEDAKAKAGEVTLQAAQRERFFALCEAKGLSVSREARIPSSKEARSLAFRALVDDAYKFGRKETGRSDTDHSVSVPIVIPPKGIS